MWKAGEVFKHQENSCYGIQLSSSLPPSLPSRQLRPVVESLDSWIYHLRLCPQFLHLGNGDDNGTYLQSVGQIK